MLYYLRKLYKILSGRKHSFIDTKDFSRVNLTSDKTSSIICKWILEKKPFIVTRFGNIELTWYVEYKLLGKSFASRSHYYITNKIRNWRASERNIVHPYFYPSNDRFNTEFYINATERVIPEIDLLGSWSSGEKLDVVGLKCNLLTHIFDIEPYRSIHPWSLALKGKKVMIIHPMVHLFIKQMENRERLFEFPVLPIFDIIPVKALFFDDPVFNSWSKVYNYYSDIIERTDFDIALIGCGTWGMPICYEVKRKGKQAIHLGGATQILFGIMGKRWRNWPEYSNLVNQYWITKHTEIPTAAKLIEDGCYW